MRFVWTSLFLSVSVSAFAETLTIQDVISLAKKNNGTLKAASKDVRASQSRVKQAYAAFFPTLTPSLTYVDSVRNVPNPQFGNQRQVFEQTSTEANFSWRIFDNGQRINRVRQARESESAQKAESQRQIREVLFSVQQNYLETLRAQALEKVAESQKQRAESVLEQTKARVKAGDAARRETLQAQADALNATVNLINARNRINTNLANLKASIGVPAENSIGELAPLMLQVAKEEAISLPATIKTGLELRPDLISRRKNLNAQRESLRGAELENGLLWSLDFTYGSQFTPISSSDQNLQFRISIPLFDGGLRRAQLNEQKHVLGSQKDQLVQAERNAASEIEAAYLTVQQNRKRYESALLALEAAKLNFESATESQKLGASDLLEVLTAQVSLVTAESNLIEATYDTILSQARLMLVTGLPLMGEDL